MKSISLVWTDTVDDLEVRFGLAAVQEIVNSLQVIGFRRGLFQAAPTVNVFGNWVIPALPQGSDYSSLQWYVDNSYDHERGRIIGSKLLDLILNEPWQRSGAHYDVMMIGDNLVPSTENRPEYEALALSLPGCVTVVSMAPLHRINDERARLFVVRRVVGHQLGHLFGIPRAERPGIVSQPPGERHCPNLCAMRDADDLDTLVSMTMEELEAHVLLCADCWQDLLQIMVDSYHGMN